MPKAKKKPVMTPAPPMPVQEDVPTLSPTEPSANGVTTTVPLVYDKLDFKEYSTTSQRGPLTVEIMRNLLGWETEAQFKARSTQEYEEHRAVLQSGGSVPQWWEDYITVNSNGTAPEHWLYGDNYHCKDVSGAKIRCTRNLNNRPFDEKWCGDLKHTILSGKWAGPHTIPGETVNCETIRISRYGHVISGQHQMTAAILADEQLLLDRENGMDNPDRPKYPAWRTHGHVFLETVVATGMSEDPRVLMTVDYVKPRTVADVFYTSSVFKDSSAQDRKELCRVLERACDFLWTRTDARGYRTHLEVVGFLERHPRLLDCVMHLFKLNRATKLGGRRISALRLSPGQCASLMYVMGSSAGSEADPEYGDQYRNMDPAPAEKDERGKDALNWDHWDKAADFWTNLAGFPGEKDFVEVRKALGQLVTSKVESEDNLGMGGRLPEKLAVLAKAWEVWKDHPESAGVPFNESDRRQDGRLFLTYVDFDSEGKKLPDGQIELVDVADFYGIDCPKSAGKGKSSREVDPPPPTEEEISQLREEAQARRTAPQPARK